MYISDTSHNCFKNHNSRYKIILMIILERNISVFFRVVIDEQRLIHIIINTEMRTEYLILCYPIPYVMLTTIVSLIEACFMYLCVPVLVYSELYFDCVHNQACIYLYDCVYRGCLLCNAINHTCRVRHSYLYIYIYMNLNTLLFLCAISIMAMFVCLSYI